MNENTENPSLLGLRLKNRLSAGELTLCFTIRFSRSVEAVQIAKTAGYDALYLDLEHSTLTIDQASQISPHQRAPSGEWTRRRGALMRGYLEAPA